MQNVCDSVSDISISFSACDGNITEGDFKVYDISHRDELLSVDKSS